ncbi:endonuclease III [Candidatus Woesearchaeota archaeon]|nr:endonuclease III [Candidatus Woesearchaeota archaeon]
MKKLSKKVDIDAIYKILIKEVANYNVPVVDLIKIQTNDPAKVLIATILSARTKDQTTVQACRKLFARIKKIDELEYLSIKEIEQLIYPVGFYHTKAKHLKELPKVLREEFTGKIPETVEELVKLPGVGRKTANLVVAVGFQKPAVCIDTHCHKIFNRLGYVKTKSPYETEMEVRRKMPIKYWEKINSMLVAFGQNTCTPISPWCSRCPIIKYCNRIGVESSR